MSTPQSGTESDFDSGIIRVEARIHIVREKDHHSHSLATKDTSIQNILLGTAESYICFIVFVNLSFFFKFVNSTILALCQKHFASYVCFTTRWNRIAYYRSFYLLCRTSSWMSSISVCWSYPRWSLSSSLFPFSWTATTFHSSSSRSSMYPRLQRHS